MVGATGSTPVMAFALPLVVIMPPAVRCA